MNRAIVGFALLAASILPAGCTNTGTGARISVTQAPPQLSVETLKRNEYTILEAVEGKSTVKYKQYLYFFRTFDPNDPRVDETSAAGAKPAPEGLAALPFIGGFLTAGGSGHGWLLTGEPAMDEWVKEQAEARALHQAIDAVPGADTLIAPRFSWNWKVKDNLIGAEYEATCTCKGKAISIKTGDLPYTQMYLPK